MFRKKIISINTNDDDLIKIKDISGEKFNKNIKLFVEPEYKVVVLKNNVQFGEVFEVGGEYKPLTKEDKKCTSIQFIFVSTKKSTPYNFITRATSFKDVNGKICNACFEGEYTFSVRNERKLLATTMATESGKDFTKTDFANLIEDRVNSAMLSYILNYYKTKKISILDVDFSKYKKDLENYVIEILDKYLDDTFGLNARSLNINALIESEMELK